MDFSGFTSSDYMNIFRQWSWLQWVVFSLVTNIFLYLFSIGLYRFIDATCRKEKLQQKDHPLSRADLYLSFVTVICNTFVMLLGVYLWKINWISLNPDHSALAVSAEVVALLLLMDFLMYLFHYAAHIPLVYRILHGKHHEHVSTNYLSLFVLHPLESIGFGVMMLILLMGYDFSVISITVYLMINLIWGTIGHLNREFFPPQLDRFFIGTTRFHNLHHSDETRNFGFYTSIWDRLFGTYKR